MPLHWIQEVADLSPVALTVQAQALSVDDVDELLHPAFFRYVAVPSIEIQNIYEIDKRYISSRREWNAQGRLIPSDSPKVEKFELTPVESYFRIDEREQQKIRERVMGNEDLFRKVIGASVPARVNALVKANYRTMEVESFEAWAKGTITQRSPQDGTTQTLSLAFATGHITTASTAWDDGGTNAYNDLMSWIATGESLIGPCMGAVLRRAIFNAIQDDAPNPMPGAISGLEPTRTQIEQRIAEELGHGFRFFIIENQFDLFDDGGTAVTRTAVWPSQYASLVPAGGTVGEIKRAPNLRAMDLAASFPGAKVDVNGMSVVYDYENAGKTAEVQCQANWLPLPTERLVYSIDTGVAS